VKLLLDHNLSWRLLAKLDPAYAGSEALLKIGLDHVDDEVVWHYAKANNHVIVTQDEDFRVRSLRLGHPPRVVMIQTGNTATANILSLLNGHVELLRRFVEDDQYSLLYLPQ